MYNVSYNLYFVLIKVMLTNFLINFPIYENNLNMEYLFEKMY